MNQNAGLNREERRKLKKKDKSFDVPTIQNKWQTFHVLPPQAVPSSHGKLHVVLDDATYPDLLKAVKQHADNQCEEEPINAKNYNVRRDEHHKSTKEVVSSIGMIAFREDDSKAETLVSRIIEANRLQIDCYSTTINGTGNNKKVDARYNISFIVNPEVFPFNFYAIKISANKGRVTNIVEMSGTEISKEAQLVCQILAVSAWVIAYFALEPVPGKSYIYPNGLLPEIPEGWYK